MLFDSICYYILVVCSNLLRKNSLNLTSKRRQFGVFGCTFCFNDFINLGFCNFVAVRLPGFNRGIVIWRLIILFRIASRNDGKINREICRVLFPIRYEITRQDILRWYHLYRCIVKRPLLFFLFNLIDLDLSFTLSCIFPAFDCLSLLSADRFDWRLVMYRTALIV